MQLNLKPHVAIIILNWNGWKDTLECLESVLKLDYPNFNVILIDNNSSDESIPQIISWAHGTMIPIIDSRFPEIIYPLEKKPISYFIASISESEKIEMDMHKVKLIFFKSATNLGFAVANNKGMEIASHFYKSEYYFLLNNDTIIKKDALTNLIDLLEKDKSTGTAQSTIYDYHNPQYINNAGGMILFWGQTKYYRKIKLTEVKRITFINGCALCVRSDIISKFGPLSDKYFFGEEDFEFSYRLNKLSIKMVCLGNSCVFHKVGTSAQVLLINKERSIILFALNRILDLRDYYPNGLWFIWKYFALTYFGYLLWIKYKVPLRRTITVILFIHHKVNIILDVRKETVENILKEV